MFNLYLMRHGYAEAGRGLPDYMRALTEEGREDATRQGRLIAEREGKIDRILHSPYKRATETADLVNQTLDVPMDSMEYITPSGSPELALDAISGVEENILIVTHLPFIAEFAQYLTGQNLGFFPGTVAQIQRKDSYARQGELIWIEHA